MKAYAQFASFAFLFFVAAPGVSRKAQKQELKEQREVAKLEAKFAKQKNAVRQAKLLAKLLPREVDLAAEEIHQGEYDQGIARLQHWSAQTQQVHEALIATGRNAVKRSAGFTELQVALRESLRGVRDIIFSMPLGHRRRAETVQTDLSQLNSQLLQELFPPPAPGKKKKGKP